MKFINVYRTLEANNLFVFSFDDLLLLYPDETKKNLRKVMYRWKRKGWVASLKKGLYEIAYPKPLNIPDFYVANKMYQPSYVSLETALSFYSVIPEVSMAVTSITTKPTRKYKNRHGLFLYRTVRSELFKGYSIEENKGFLILIAEPEKAFIDYLYYQNYRKKKFRMPDQRFDKEKIKVFNKKKITEYAKLYDLNAREIYANL
jgi:predicted transcriptional regulator of viral defense system